MIASLSVMSMAFGRRAKGMMSMRSPRSFTFLVGDRNAVIAGADQLLVDGLALGVQLQAAEEVGALGEIGELLVAADLRGGELVGPTGTKLFGD